MVDFGRRRQGGLQPSRSLPMSTLNQRERSAPAPARVERRILRVNSSKTSTPNPYSQRETTSMFKAPRRVLSAARARSSSPSKPEEPNGSSSLLCSLPNNKDKPRRRQHHFGMIKAVVRAVSMLVMGFGGGILYNMYTDYSSSSVEESPSMDLLPPLVNDELVKKLAMDNQLQESEIEALKKQVQAAQNQSPKRYVAVGKYDENGHFQKYSDQERRVVSGNNNNYLRTSPQQQFSKDSQDNEFAMLPTKDSKDNQLLHADHEINRDNYQEEHEAHQEQLLQQQLLERDESHENEQEEEQPNVDQQQRDEAYHQEAQDPSKDPPERPHVAPSSASNEEEEAHEGHKEEPPPVLQQDNPPIIHKDPILKEQQQEQWDHKAEQLHDQNWHEHTQQTANDNGEEERLAEQQPEEELQQQQQEHPPPPHSHHQDSHSAEEEEEEHSLENSEPRNHDSLEQHLQEQDWDHPNKDYQQVEQEHDQNNLQQQQHQDQHWDQPQEVQQQQQEQQQQVQ